MSGYEIANTYVSLYTRMPGVHKDIEKALGGADAGNVGQGVGQRFSAGLAGAVGGAVASVTSKAIDLIGQSLDGAIRRVDTMNNFPKIMKNLGYESDEASASIQMISTRLSGLPTALDQMAGTVQQLAPLTTGLEEATELSLALNNALLAGGKPAEIQANAMEQYTQMLAVGKVDMAAWRSMVSAMPGQMDQLAQSLLGTEAKSMDLYEALKDGTLGFSDFNAAVLQLNTEGTGAFASFEQQARDSTDGISTQQANLSTAITRSLAQVIEKGRPLISTFLDGATQLVNALAPVAVQIVDILLATLDWAAANQEWLIPAGIFVGVIAAIITGVKLAAAAKLAWAAAMGGAQIVTMLSGSSLSIYNGLVKAQTIATNIAAGAQRLWNAALSANPIGIIITLIAALVAGLIYFFTQTELGREVWANITQFIGDAITWLWETILQPAFAWIAEAWAAVVGFFESAWQTVLKPALDAIGAAFTWIYENIIIPVLTGIFLWLGLWAALVEWLWQAAIQPALAAIGSFFVWVYESVILPIVEGIIAYVQLWGEIFSWLWANAIKPAIDAIAAAAQWVYQSVILPIVDGIIAYVQMWGEIFSWLWANAIKPAIDAIAAGLQWVYQSVILPTANFIRSAVTAIGNTFRTVFGAIGGFIRSAFQGALAAVRGPINGIISLVNSAIGALNGLKVTIPDWVPMVGGQTWGVNLPTIPHLAAGATVLPRSGGTLAILAEAGSAESVVDTGLINRALRDGLDGREKGPTVVQQHNEVTMTERDPRLLMRQFGRELGAALP